jgi:signal transduction histidine kinase
MEQATASGGAIRQFDGAWRMWERLRDWDRRYAMVVDTAVAVGLFLICSGWLRDLGTERSSLWLVAGLTLPLVLRRKAPIAVFGTLALVALIQWFTTTPLLADAALLVALYTVGAESHWTQVVLASVLLEVGVIMATVQWVPTGSHFTSLVFLTGLAFAALLAGEVVRALRSQMGWLAERAQRLEVERDQQASLAAATERARIAREMHDVVSHNIQVMVTLADAATASQHSNPARAAETMGEVSDTGRQALTDMRRMLGVLREESADLPLAPQPGLDELGALVERVRATGLNVALHQLGERFELSEAAELTIYRIVQEALTNVLKHASSPGSVEVTLTFSAPDVSASVADDGQARSIPPSASPSTNGGGHGVAGMTERAAAFNGTLLAGPQAGGGWRVTADLRACLAGARP